MDISSKFRFTLLRCARLFSDEVNIVLMQHQLNYSLWQTLVIIHLNQQCTALDIANELSISKPAVTKRLNSLHHLGCLEHIPMLDKRQKKLSLSQHGYNLFTLCLKDIDRLETQLLAEFDQTELQQSHGFLLKLLTSLQDRKESKHD